MTKPNSQNKSTQDETQNAPETQIATPATETETTPIVDEETGEVKEADDVPSEVALPHTNFSEGELSHLLRMSENLDQKTVALTMTAKSLTFEKKGESFRGIFAGWTTMKVKDKVSGEIKEITAARFFKDKEIYINGGVVLIDEIQRSGISAGVGVEITYLGKEGNTKLYSVGLLG